MASKEKIKAIAYLRTSTSTNAGPDKDSDKRQREAIEAYAKSAGYEIVAEYYDVTSGENSIDDRPQFAAMMERILSNGVRTIIVETANRFARDLIVQEVGYKMLKAKGIELIAADKPDAFLDDTPTAVLIRQVLGAVSQFEKAMVVNKLRGARDRKSKEAGRRIEGMKPLKERDPALYDAVKKLHRYPVNGKRRSLRQIAKDLAAQGFLDRKGKEYSAQSIKQMLEG